MLLLQHVGELALFCVILFSPFPLCLVAARLIANQTLISGLAHSILLILTLWCVIQVCIGLLLGLVHHLFLTEVLIVNVLLLLSGILCLIWVRRSGVNGAIEPLFKVHPKLNRFEQIILIAISCLGAVLLRKLALQPITNYDSLAYHLPTMMEWYQAGHLPIFSKYLTNQIGYYPYSWELLCLLFIMPFREDFLVSFPNFIAWLIFGLSIYKLSDQLQAGRIYSLAAASLALSVPAVLNNINTMHVDLPMAAFFIVSLYWLTLFIQSPTLISFCLFLMTIGMLVSIKTSGILYAAILGFVLLVHLIMNRRKVFSGNVVRSSSISAQGMVILYGSSLLCFLLIGSFWYVKNFLATGNPLGLLHIKVAGLTIFPGNLETAEIRKTTLAKLFDVTSIHDWQVWLSQVLIELQLPFLLVALQFATALPKTLGFWQKKPETNHFRNSSLLLLILLIVMGLLYWTTPYSADTLIGENKWKITPWVGQGLRYAFPFVGALSVAAAIGATQMQTSRQLVLAFTLVSIILGTLQISSYSLQFNSLF